MTSGRRGESSPNPGPDPEGLATLQAEYRPRVEGLYEATLMHIAKDSGVALEVGRGQERVSRTSAILRYDDKLYKGRAFVRDEASSGSTALEAGFRLWPAGVEYDPAAPPRELVATEAGLLVTDEKNPTDETFSRDIDFMQLMLKALHTKLEDKKYIKRVQRREALRRARQRVVVTVAGTTAVAAAASVPVAFVGVSFFGKPNVPSLRWGGISRFDAHKRTLPGGKVIKPGPIITPVFSPRLAQDKELGQNKVPRINHNIGGYHKHPFDHELSSGDGLREVFVTSSKPGMNCATVSIRDSEKIASATVATDFAGPDGTSRASELRFRLVTPDSSAEAGAAPGIIACWYGQERNDNDDPRVVFQLHKK